VKTGIGAVIRNGSGPLTLPIVDPFCQIPSFTCGTEFINVAPGETRAVTPGTYGFVRVANGATLHLAGGIYTMCDVKTGRGVHHRDGPVYCRSPAVSDRAKVSYSGRTRARRHRCLRG
jgi:hypothetical protein